MYLLTRNSLTRGEWFQPDSQSLNWTERDSSSSITLGRDGVPEISLGDWVLDEDGPAGATVWRVKTIDDQTNAETVTIELEHILQTLEDVSLFGTTTAADMGGGTTVSAETAARWVLNHQSDWVLGDFSHSVSMAYEFNGETLLDALETISGTLTNPQWEYDLTSYPFTLHIRVRTDTVTSEMRGGRNLTSLRKSVSRANMFTRIYPIGKNDLHLTGGYLSKNESIYGRIDKIQTESSIGDEAMLQAWAQGQLDRHAEPIVTVTISGFEYRQETGEDLDQVKLNAGCRVPLPEYGTVITERIVRVQWRDRIKEPDVVTITLANNQDDVSRILKENRKSSGKSARGQAKQNYLFEANGEHLLYEVFDECGYLHGILRMTEQSLRIAFDNEIESLHSEFTMTAQSLRIAFTNEIASTRSEFNMTAESLRIVFQNEITSTRTEIQQTDTRVAMVVGTTSDGRNFIKSGEIAVAINESTGESEAKIDADHVYIGNTKSTTVISGKCSLSDVTADYIAGKIANIALLGVQSINGQANNSYTSMKSFYGSNYYVGVSGGGGSVSYNNLANGVYDLQITSSGNDYTLQKKNASGGQWVDVGTFSRATSLSGSWSGRNYTVTASPQGATKTGIVYDGLVPTGSVSKSGKNVSRDFIVYSDDGEGSADSIIMTKTATISASDVWDDGWDAALGEITYPSAAASGTEVTSFSITVPKADRSGGESKTFTLSKGSPSSSGGYASVSLSGTVVGRISISNWYSSGYTAGGTAAGVSGSWSGATFTVSRVADTALKSTSCTVSIYPSSTQNLSYGGSVTVYANAGGSSRASVTVNAPSAPSHSITGFDTTAPAGATYDGNTNNSDGYYISGSSYSASVGCVVKGVWNCDGNQRTGYSYLAKVPTIIYKKGWDNGRSALTSYSLYCSSKEYISSGVRCRFTIERSSLPFSEGTTYTFYRT